MSAPNINPNHAYAITAGATAMSWVNGFDVFLHILASIVVIASGLTAIFTYVRNARTKK